MFPNRIHSHPVDHGTGGSRERDNGEKWRCVWYGCRTKGWSINKGSGINVKRRKWWNLNHMVIIVTMPMKVLLYFIPNHDVSLILTNVHLLFPTDSQCWCLLNMTTIVP